LEKCIAFKNNNVVSLHVVLASYCCNKLQKCGGLRKIQLLCHSSGGQVQMVKTLNHNKDIGRAYSLSCVGENQFPTFSSSFLIFEASHTA
jgi:hypothetical protein